MKDEKRAENAVALIKAGYGDHILLSSDVSRRSYFISKGGMGYTAVMNSVVPLMKKYGALQEDIDKLLIHNPARILDNNWE